MNRAAQEIQVSEEEPGALDDQEQACEQHGVFGRAVYSASYCVGYGAAFPTFLVVGMLPMDNPLGRGLRDGVSSARQAVGQREAARAAGQAVKGPASTKASPLAAE